MNKFTSSILLISLTPIISLYGNSKKPPVQETCNPVVYGEVDYLLWFANPDGLHSPTVATGSSPHLDTKWSSGVRASIGTRPSSWDTNFTYSYYSTTSHAKGHANIETILTSTPSTAGIFEVGARWTLNFNRLDWELGRKILFGQTFSFRPFLGLEGLDIAQKFDQNTNTIFLDLANRLPATDIVTSKNRNSFLSIGPRAGFDASFLLGSGFEFYGIVSGSILWGKFNIKQHYNQTDFYSSGTTTELVDQTQRLSQSGSIFNCDLSIGFDWRHCFQKSKLELLLNFGWEQHYYTDIVRFQDFYLQQVSTGTAAYLSDGNLTLSGFIFGVSLGY